MKTAITIMSLFIVAVISLLIVAVIVFSAAVPLINDKAARDTAKVLAEIPLPENTRLIESVSRAGKLVGSGNGMQFFGAVLLESELSLEELDAHYSSYTDNECEIRKQDGSEVEVIEHGRLAFKSDTGENSYIVYLWGSSNNVFGDWDLRGH